MEQAVFETVERGMSYSSSTVPGRHVGHADATVFKVVVI
jgi:hypothetical protein